MNQTMVNWQELNPNRKFVIKKFKIRVSLLEDKDLEKKIKLPFLLLSQEMDYGKGQLIALYSLVNLRKKNVKPLLLTKKKRILSMILLLAVLQLKTITT